MTPQQAYDRPYDYESQEQFLNEADALLEVALAAFNEMNMKFTRADRRGREGAPAVRF